MPRGTPHARAPGGRAGDSGRGKRDMDDKADTNRPRDLPPRGDLPPREEMPGRETPARKQREQQQQ